MGLVSCLYCIINIIYASSIIHNHNKYLIVSDFHTTQLELYKWGFYYLKIWSCIIILYYIYKQLYKLVNNKHKQFKTIRLFKTIIINCKIIYIKHIAQNIVIFILNFIHNRQLAQINYTICTILDRHFWHTFCTIKLNCNCAIVTKQE